MKFLITLSLAAFSVGAFAQDDLATMKEDATSHIDQKISSLQEAKDCINNAGSIDKFKACKYDLHKQKKEMKMQKMEEMKQKEEEKKESDK